jgi:hypothetical protein
LTGEGFEVSAQPKAELAGTIGVVHQSLRREVNERISALSSTFAVTEPETIDVICECVRAECEARITMTVAEYELVRRFPSRFFVKSGHDVAEEERVVAESDGYVVIEASGRGGLYAVSADPRSPYRRPEAVGT